MAVKKRIREHLRRHRPRRQSYTPAEAAEMLAPLEERAQQKTSHNGTIVVGTGELKLPQALLGEEEEKRGWWGLEPVVVILLAASLVFILWVAYRIRREPKKPDYMPVKVVADSQ